MRYQRWCVATIDSDGCPKELRGKARGWSTRLIFADGRGLFDCEFETHEMDAAQGITGLIVLPSLTAPASRLPAAVLAWLQAKGVTPASDDTVLNLLRALRDKFGAKFLVDLPG